MSPWVPRAAGSDKPHREHLDQQPPKLAPPGVLQTAPQVSKDPKMPPNHGTSYARGQTSWGHVPAGERPHAGGSGYGSKPLPPGTPSPSHSGEPPGLAGTSLVCGTGCQPRCHRCHQHGVTRSGPAHPGREPSPRHAPKGTINHRGCGSEGGGSVSGAQQARGPGGPGRSLAPFRTRQPHRWSGRAPAHPNPQGTPTGSRGDTPLPTKRPSRAPAWRSLGGPLAARLMLLRGVIFELGKVCVCRILQVPGEEVWGVRLGPTAPRGDTRCVQQPKPRALATAPKGKTTGVTAPSRFPGRGLTSKACCSKRWRRSASCSLANSLFAVCRIFSASSPEQSSSCGDGTGPG